MKTDRKWTKLKEGVKLEDIKFLGKVIGIIIIGFMLIGLPGAFIEICFFEGDGILGGLISILIAIILYCVIQEINYQSKK